MNRICIWLLAAASAVCLCMLPRTGTDAAKLLPAQVLVIGAGDGAITVEADNGAAGSGPTLAAALADMAECAEGTLFLDTAEHIVLLQSAGAARGRGCGVFTGAPGDADARACARGAGPRGSDPPGAAAAGGGRRDEACRIS